MTQLETGKGDSDLETATVQSSFDREKIPIPNLHPTRMFFRLSLIAVSNSTKGRVSW
jgi:hypothetical protein